MLRLEPNSALLAHAAHLRFDHPKIRSSFDESMRRAKSLSETYTLLGREKRERLVLYDTTARYTDSSCRETIPSSHRPWTIGGPFRPFASMASG